MYNISTVHSIKAKAKTMSLWYYLEDFSPDEVFDEMRAENEAEILAEIWMEQEQSTFQFEKFLQDLEFEDAFFEDELWFLV